MVVMGRVQELGAKFSTPLTKSDSRGIFASVWLQILNLDLVMVGSAHLGRPDREL